MQLDVSSIEEGLAQVVYTLTQFPEVEQVEVQDGVRDAADFEDQTPAILVESPLAFEDVASPLRVTGTANTFEANFQYELTDTDGRIVDESFVTATSGSGTRGTFDFTTAAYTVPFDGVGALIVFESSAKDGSRINLVEIPLRMTRVGAALLYARDMADAPWRCSECGTVNEPVANSCRTCGSWPSLFDLQDSLVEDVEREDRASRRRAPSFPWTPPSSSRRSSSRRPSSRSRSRPTRSSRSPTSRSRTSSTTPRTRPAAGDRPGRVSPRSSSRSRFAIYLVISLVLGDR